MMLAAEYGRLLWDILPTVPRNRAENERLLAEIEKLMRKGEDHLTPAEDAMLAVLFSLVREYEHRRVSRRAATPLEMLEFLIEQNHLAPADLPLPANRVSEILSGKRGISKQQAKKLGAFFSVSSGLFI
jgi:HTH-type transcriptional regulator/antitoxin HigA